VSDNTKDKRKLNRPSLRDVAAEADVSMMTVSRALSGNGKISVDTRNRVLQAAQKVGYRPNLTARALRTNESKLVGVTSPNLMMPLHIEITLGAKEAFSAEGYRILLTVDPIHENDQSPFITDGDLILGSPPHHHSMENYTDRTRTVSLMGNEDLEIDTCSSDLTQPAMFATHHFLTAGYRNIGILQLERSPSVDGYTQAHEDFGLAVNPDLVQIVGNDEPSVSQAIDRLLAMPTAPDALFVAGVAATPLALRALRRREFHVPRDFGFIGSESRRSELGDLVYPGMTAIRIPGYEIGAAGARRLIERLRGDTSPPHRMNFPSELVIRESTPGPGRS
jgi:LacI family transcriptional regulator